MKNVTLNGETTNSTENVLSIKLSSGHQLEFKIQQIVYLKTDIEQKPRIVTGIFLRPFNSVTYSLSEGNTETCHYGFEINDERDIIMATS